MSQVRRPSSFRFVRFATYRGRPHLGVSKKTPVSMCCVNHRRAFVILHGIAFVAMMILGCGSASAQSGGLFDALFGGFMRAPPPATPRPLPPASSGTPRVSITVTPRSPVGIRGSVAHCVRLCDGGHFPLPQLATSAATPEKLCNALCPGAQTRIYWGSQIDRARAANGARYAQLETAFKYRRRATGDCTCNGMDVFGTPAISIYEDITLRPEDIVVTDNGLEVFEGLRGDEHKSIEFTPIQQSPKLSAQVHEQLGKIRIAPRSSVGPRSITFNARVVFGFEPLSNQVLEPDTKPSNQGKQ
jgi:hypothetical protein